MAEKGPTQATSGFERQGIESSSQDAYPTVLYFEDDLPSDLLESGLYVGYEDFKDVAGDVGMNPEPLANLYHSLILHFTQHDGRMHEQALRHLRYNSSNRSFWNKHATTYQYYLSTQVLAEYSGHSADGKHKIPGIGVKGRKVMRAVLGSDEDPFYSELGVAAASGRN